MLKQKLYESQREDEIEEISFNFDELHSRQGPQAPQVGFLDDGESDIGALHEDLDDDLLENVLDQKQDAIPDCLRRDIHKNTA